MTTECWDLLDSPEMAHAYGFRLGYLAGLRHAVQNAGLSPLAAFRIAVAQFGLFPFGFASVTSPEERYWVFQFEDSLADFQCAVGEMQESPDGP